MATLAPSPTLDFSRAVVHELHSIRQSISELTQSAHAISWSEICRDQTPWLDRETQLSVVDLDKENIIRVVDLVVKIWANSIESKTLITQLIRDCQFVAREIASSSNLDCRLSICGSKEKGIMGIMRWHPSKEEGIRVSYLMTSPLNKIPSPFNRGFLQTRGVGSSLLRYVQMKCIQEQTPKIYLRHLIRSFSFYERHGFRLEETYMTWQPPHDYHIKRPSVSLAVDRWLRNEDIVLPIFDAQRD